jgi:2-haloacid dehalogenase
MRPAVIVFDVNETLSDMAPMGQHFAELGASEEHAKTWFASVLRDGFALAAAGANTDFRTVAESALRSIFAGQRLNRPDDEAVAYVLECMMGLAVHPDVPDGVARLAADGHRLVTLTNGAAATAEALLTRAGVRDRFEALLSVEDAPRWKPAAEAYRYAAHRCGVPLEKMLLVAVHPWDIDGAARAGMQTAWINRSGTAYPPFFRAPNHTVGALPELAELVAR